MSLCIRLIFLGNLRELLPPRLRRREEVPRVLQERGAIKDVIESMGVVHPEVGSIEADGRQVDFSYLVRGGELVRVAPLPVPCPVRKPTLLRPRPLRRITFLADINVAKLGRLLRMAGFDTRILPARSSDRTIAHTAAREERILLSRDRNLLKYSCVCFAHLVRATDPWEQLAETVRLYGLVSELRLFSRCPRCNRLLRRVSRDEVLEQLEPLTRKYYDRFSRCPGCDTIYWQGSHHEKMVSWWKKNFFHP